MYRQSKLKALVTNIVMQCIKGVEATDVSDMLCTCKTQWYIMGVTVIAQLPTHSFGMLQNQPKCGSLSNPLENQLAVG